GAAGMLCGPRFRFPFALRFVPIRYALAVDSPGGGTLRTPSGPQQWEAGTLLENGDVVRRDGCEHLRDESIHRPPLDPPGHDHQVVFGCDPDDVRPRTECEEARLRGVGVLASVGVEPPHQAVARVEF